MPMPWQFPPPDAAPRQVDHLLRLLRRRAAAERPLPSLRVFADSLCVTDSRVGELLRQGEAEGLWVVRHDGRFRIAEIAAPDGSWSVARAVPQRLPKRLCLACRKPFEPEHRFNFLCCAGRASEAA